METDWSLPAALSSGLLEYTKRPVTSNNCTTIGAAAGRSNDT